MIEEYDDMERIKEWHKLVEDYEKFFYSDNGIFTVSLFDIELEKYNIDFENIKVLIKKLKDFEAKYGELDKDEMLYLLKLKDVLLDIDTGTNGIKDMYEKMCDMYEFIDEY